MESIKGFINALVIAFKLLIWTLLVLYALVGLYLLLNGNPTKRDPQYTRIHRKAWEFSFMAFFITILLLPGIFILYLMISDNSNLDYDAIAGVLLWYIGVLGFGCVVGLINYLIAD